MLSFEVPPFIQGMDLNRMFFQQVVKPLIDKNFSGLCYSAGMVGEGSDVMRFDTPTSIDHNWGPHVRIFLSEKDFAKKDEIHEMLARELPYEFMGFPTNFTKPNESSYLVQQMKRIKKGPVNHMVQFYTIKSFFEHYLGTDPYKELTAEDWLVFPQQALVEVTGGEVFYDGLNEFNAIRDKFKYYPDEVWKYMYLIQWDKIANEESFMGRSGEVGDELGSNIIATSIVNNIMKLGFLMEKVYTPYIKWFGTGFSRLKCAAELTHILMSVVQSRSWNEREEFLGQAYEIIARMHNDLKITKPISTETSNFNGRPYKVIHAHDVYGKIEETITDPFFKNMKYKIGSIDQFIAHTRINHMNYAYLEFKKVIK